MAVRAGTMARKNATDRTGLVRPSVRQGGDALELAGRGGPATFNDASVRGSGAGALHAMLLCARPFRNGCDKQRGYRRRRQTAARVARL